MVDLFHQHLTGRPGSLRAQPAFGELLGQSPEPARHRFGPWSFLSWNSLSSGPGSGERLQRSAEIPQQVLRRLELIGSSPHQVID